MHRSRTNRVLWAVALLGGPACLWVQLCQAQSSNCTYDQCAVRFHSGRLVQGLEGKPFARLGIFSTRIAPFERSSDSVRAHYNSFRSRQRTGTALEFLGLAAMTAGLVVIADRGHSADAGQVLFFAGIGISLGGGFAFRSAGNHLSQAVWWYNREFARAPQ